MTTGMPATAASAFSAPSTDQPSMPGMVTSSRMTWGRSALAIARPVAPSAAERAA